jgi:hypothetical protein
MTSAPVRAPVPDHGWQATIQALASLFDPISGLVRGLSSGGTVVVMADGSGRFPAHRP